MTTETQTQCRIREALERIPLDVHASLIWDSARERAHTVAAFLEIGMERRESCVYQGPEEAVAQIVQAMEENEFETGKYLRSGALALIATAGDGSALEERVLEALKAAPGDRAVRLVREVGPVARPARDAVRHTIAEICAERNYLDLSVYERSAFRAQELLNAVRSHRIVIWNGVVCDNLHTGEAEEWQAPEATGRDLDRVLTNLRDRQIGEDRLRNESANSVLLPVQSLLNGPPESRSGCLGCLDQMFALQEQIGHTHKMQALGHMAAGLVHQFRNFLAVVQGCGEMLMETLEPSDKRTFLVQRILDTSMSAAVLSNHLLAFGRPPRIRTERVDLNHAVAELAPDLRETASDGVAVRFVPAAAECPVSLDLGQLEQVLLNLMANSCDAMPNGGTITITTAPVELRPDNMADHSGLRPGRYVALSLTDTGVGIAEKARNRIFDPFYTTKQPGKGLGLGLSIVHGIVQNHFRGTISLESVVGMGTTFTIYIPRAESASRAVA